MKIRIILLIAISLFAYNFAAAQNTATWNPQRTWVFFAGLLEWQDSKTFASFPQENRRDAILLDELRKSGVPESQIVYLKDSEGTTANIQAKMAAHLAKAKPGDWAFVYYCGHGYKTDDTADAYLASYDVSDTNLGWKVASIPDAIDASFKGSHAIVALDNCYSGSMKDAVEAKQRRISYAVLASSSASELSTGNWTFTEALVSAFRGSAFSDDNADGRVTFAELGANAKEDMLFGEEQFATIHFGSGFNPQTAIAKTPVKSVARIGERVEAYSIDGWYKGFITDSNNGKFKIHYYGYEDADDEWVTPKMIRIFKPKQYPVGAHVSVEWEKKWYPAKALR